MNKLISIGTYMYNPNLSIYGNGIFDLIGKISHCYNICDRYNILNNDFYKYNVVIEKEDIPPNFKKSIKFNKSFDEISTSVSDNILKKIKDENKILMVWWSGGVDSTSMLCSLLKSKYFEKDNICVILTASSKIEYPKFYTYIIQNLNYIYFDSIIDCIGYFDKNNRQNYENRLFVDGCSGDQLVGSPIFNYVETYDMKWQDGFRCIVEKYTNLSDKYIEIYIKILSEYFTKIGNYDYINYMSEFMWFLNYSIKWIYDKYSTIEIFTRFNPYIFNNRLSFYSDIKFQKWAIANSNKIKEHNIYEENNAEYFKVDFKKIIYDFFGDKDYNKKAKIPSQGAMEKLLSKKNTIPHFYLIGDDRNIQFSSYDFSLVNKNRYILKEYLKIFRLLNPYINNNYNMEYEYSTKIFYKK